MTSTRATRRNVMITDLDESDTPKEQARASSAKVTKKDKMQKKQQRLQGSTKNLLQTISGNFSRRAHSVELIANNPKDAYDRNEQTQEFEQQRTKEVAKNTKLHSYFNDLLQTKEKQMEKLLQRIATLHQYNEQFSMENEKLRKDVRELNKCNSSLRKQLADCDNCKKLTAQLTESAAQQQQLSSDVEMMKTLVYRLNVQIEAYQDKIRHSRTANSSHANKPTLTQKQQLQQTNLPTWSDQELQTTTITPLLSAYDELLNEKEELLQQLQQDFENFSGKMKDVVEENNRLVKSNESLKHDVGNWREERTCLKAQLEVCRSKAEAHMRKSDLAKEKLVEVMHCYEQKMQTLVLDMEHLQSAYARCKSELAGYKSAQAHASTPSIAESLQECKDLLEHLKKQHNREKSTLEESLTELTCKHQKLKDENEGMRREKANLTAKMEDLQKRASALQRVTERIKRSRDSLKARLRIALQWAQKLEEGQASVQSTWDALKRMETVVKHKESQLRGLQARHLEEIDKYEKRLSQKEDTIRNILKVRLSGAKTAADITTALKAQ